MLLSHPPELPRGSDLERSHVRQTPLEEGSMVPKLMSEAHKRTRATLEAQEWEDVPRAADPALAPANAGATPASRSMADAKLRVNQ